MKLNNKKNILTLTLSVLCAVLLAVGVSFMLPKNQTKTAAAATPNGFSLALTEKRFWERGGTSPKSVPVSSMSKSGSNLSASLSGNTFTFGGAGNSYNGEAVYIEFIASIVVPAREQYTVDFNLNVSTVKTAYIESTFVLEVLNFGYSNATQTAPTALSESLTFGYSSSGSPHSIYFSANASYSGGSSLTVTKDVTSVVYKNETGKEQTFSQRFGVWTGIGYGTSNRSTIQGNCILTAKVNDTEILQFTEPSAVTQVFNGNDMLSPVDSSLLNSGWYVDGGMTLSCAETVRNAGTYMVTATLRPDLIEQNKIWQLNDGTSTADPQTFTFTVTQKPITYTLANVVTGDLVYGVPDVGKVEAVYTGVEASDVGTVHGPDLVLYYKSTDNYGYGTGADDDSGKGFGSLTAPTEAGSYEVTAVDKNAASSNYEMVCGNSPYRFTILPKEVRAPLTLAPKAYDGNVQTFTVNNYDSALMNYVLPAGMTKGSSPKAFEATAAGKYEVEFKLLETSGGTVRNYVWDDGSTASVKVVYEITPKQLEFVFAPPNGGTSWQIKSTIKGAVTWNYDGTNSPVTPSDTGVADEPRFVYYYYYKDDGAANKVVLPEGDPLNVENLINLLGLHEIGKYVIGLEFAKDLSGGDYAVNLNYVLGGSCEQEIEIIAGEAGLDDLEINYKKGGDMPLPLAGAKLNYDLDEYGNAVQYAFLVSFSNLDYMEADGAYIYEYVNAGGSTTPAGTAYVDRAGKVRVTFPIRIKSNKQSSYKMPASYSGSKFVGYTRKDDYTAEISFEYEIGKKEIDTTGFVLQYSFDQTDWKYFTTTACDVEFAGATIFVRIDPASLVPVNAGISVMFGTDMYASGRAKQTYSPIANFTLTDNDNFTITDRAFSWRITNKKINVTNWVPGDFIVDGVDHVGEILVINGHKGLYESGVIEYEYVWSDSQGNGGTGVGEAELSKIFGLASATNQVTVTVSVRLTNGQSSTYDLTGNTTSQPFTVGSSKTTATITTAESAVYGSVDSKALGVKVEADGANLPAANPITGALLYEVYLHDYDGLSIDGISGNGYGEISTIDYSTLNAGSYVIEVRFTSAGMIDYAPKGARSLFKITPKPITVPQTNGKITYNGGYINIADYLDSNYDSSIMSLVTGYTNKNAGGYTVTFKLINNNYIWVEPAAAEQTKYSFAKITTAADGISIDNSALTATLDWTINKIILSTDSWKLNGKEGATLSALDQYQSLIADNGLDVTIGYRYYDTNGNLVADPVLKGGDKYMVEAYLAGEDAVNFEFADGEGEEKNVSARREYTVPQGGMKAMLGSTVDFVKKNWLWFVIGLAVLLFLIILIIVIAKRRKNKEERRAKKEAKEEEKRRREEEREAAKEKQRAELELAKAKQEAELAKMKAAAGLSGIGMAGVAMQQPQQMPQQQMPQPMQQSAPQQPYPQMQQYPQYPQYPQQSPMMQTPQQSAESGMMMALMQAQLAEMRAQQNAALKTELEVMKSRLDARESSAYHTTENSYARNDKQQGLTAELLGDAIIFAISKVVAGKQTAIDNEPKVIESEPPVALNAPTVYPPDTVVTTTTTVDTTSRQKASANDDVTPRAHNRTRDRRDLPFDIDGFYDAFNDK